VTGQEHLFWGQVGGGQGVEERLRKGGQSESQRFHKLTDDDDRLGVARAGLEERCWDIGGAVLGYGLV
jgi:hypothetical protein